jgi:hypothetical protein
MPSPFPGMDPYLEDPVLWSGVHAVLLTGFQAQLGPQLRPRYYVRIEERVYLSDADDPGWPIRYPDLKIVDWARGSAHMPSGGTAVEPLIVPDLMAEEVHDRYLTISDLESRSVVTVIELLSPTNKASGSQGRTEYLRKRRETLRSKVNWVEIDLLRAGVRTAVRAPLPPHDYLVYVSRVTKDDRIGNAWPVKLVEPLPTIKVPLKLGDQDAPLNLQAAFTHMYEAGSYEASCDYTRQPPLPLREDLDQWAISLLEKQGFRRQ